MQVRILMCHSFFFLLSVHSSLLHTNYTLSRKEKTKLIRGGIGSTWERNLYMHGHAEWVEKRDLT